MNLEDAMARAMLERAVKHPDCPETVVVAWRAYCSLRGPSGHWVMGKGYSNLWNSCVREFRQHYEEISEILCT